MFIRVLKSRIVKNLSTIKGFSIMEMMIVILLIAMIATISLSKLNNSFARAKIKTAQIQCRELARLLEIYKIQFGSYPDTKLGWKALVTPPDKIPLISKIPVDPWNNQYLYLYPGEHNVDGPDIISRGPDGKFSEDDIGNWSDSK